MTGLLGLTSPLWPIRYKPLPDELLSSWLVRLAHGHGMKVQTFCNLLFGNQLQVWNRDIDRLAPPWLLDSLVLHTGTPPEMAFGTTLRVFEGIVAPKFKLSGIVQWVQSMKMYHRKREGFGLQYCPACLRCDPVPYFRKTWRLSLKTFCVTHQCRLLDVCPDCSAPVSFHRLDMGRPEAGVDLPLCTCHDCGCDLASAPIKPPEVIDEEGLEALQRLLMEIDALSIGNPSQLDPSALAVLRHLTVMMLSRKRGQHLLEYLTDRFGLTPPAIAPGNRPFIETQSNATRHTLLVMACWLLCSPQVRLIQAYEADAFRHNHLLRDFTDPPGWYAQVVASIDPHRMRPRARAC
ncbi:MAG: hypothetical protein C4K60_02535 [Ideonella sp. MAG2]|nr:MAG: hypothetical protein C4K60_02535 [Ideonella sp. MAG2]